MSQSHPAGAPVQGGSQQVGGLVVGEMPLATGDSLLEMPGIGSAAQHLDIVVGFYDDIVCQGDRLAEIVVADPEIGGIEQGAVFGMDDVANTADGIVRGGEVFDGEIADLAGNPNRLSHPGETLSIPVLPGDGLTGGRSGEDRHIREVLGLQATDMVDMLMGNQAGGDVAQGEPHRVKALLKLPRAKTGIDEDRRVAANDKSGVAVAATAKKMNAHVAPLEQLTKDIDN